MLLELLEKQLFVLLESHARMLRVETSIHEVAKD